MSCEDEFSGLNENAFLWDCGETTYGEHEGSIYCL